VTNEIGAMETGSYEIAIMKARIICNWWRKWDIIPGGKKRNMEHFMLQIWAAGTDY
jgi:hypothetical protein